MTDKLSSSLSSASTKRRWEFPLGFFKTNDKPLNEAQVQEIGRIKKDDIKRAIASADKGLRLLLGAEQKLDGRK